MRLRAMLLFLPLLLSGCSLWHNTQDLFASKPQVTAQGVAGVTAKTPLTPEAIQAALDNRYRLRFGMSTGTPQGEIQAFYQVMADDQVILVIRGQTPGHVEQIDVLTDRMKTPWGAKIGMPFSALYSKAYGHCQKVEDGVECQAKESAHVSYVFTGEWLGPSSLMPADDILQRWKMSMMIWRASNE